MKVRKLIQQLDNKSYANIVQQMKEKNAAKFLFLLSNYRNKSVNDNELIKKLEISSTAFYTLKSRLADKVQEFLYENTNESRIQLLRNVANIEQLVFKSPRETAIASLKKLEKELLKIDMPNELVVVYKALKKLHLHSPKYYEYSQLYNKCVAFNLGQDKAEELLSSFCKTLSEYYLNRDQQLLDILVLYKRDMQNICNLYESHHLRVYKNILNIHFALFSPVKKEMKNDETIEDMLKGTLLIVESNKNDRTYKLMQPVIDYHQLHLYKNANFYYEKIADNTPALLLYSHSCFVFHFLISKIEYAVINQTEETLRLEASLQSYEVDIEDRSNYTLNTYYLASCEFYSKRYPETVKILTEMLNKIVFVNTPFLGIEVKLFLALSHILNGSPILAQALLRSAMRKINEEDDLIKYGNSLVLIKLLKLALSPKVKNRFKKLKELNQQLKAINNGPYRILNFIKLDDAVLKKLAQF